MNNLTEEQIEAIEDKYGIFIDNFSGEKQFDIVQWFLMGEEDRFDLAKRLEKELNAKFIELKENNIPGVLHMQGLVFEGEIE